MISAWNLLLGRDDPFQEKISLRTVKNPRLSGNVFSFIWPARSIIFKSYFSIPRWGRNAMPVSQIKETFHPRINVSGLDCAVRGNGTGIPGIT